MTDIEKVGRNKRSVSGMDDHAGNGLRPYPGLRKLVCLLAQMKTAVGHYNSELNPTAQPVRL